MARHHTIISSKETFFMFNYKYVMHFMWQCGTLTFFLAIVAVTSGIMAFNGMQQHCMVQFINFNRLNISLRPIVTIWAFRSRRERGEPAERPPSLSEVMTQLGADTPTQDPPNFWASQTGPIASLYLLPILLLHVFCSDNVTICVRWSITVSQLNWPLWTRQGPS